MSEHKDLYSAVIWFGGPIVIYFALVTVLRFLWQCLPEPLQNVLATVAAFLFAILVLIGLALSS